MQQHTVKQLHLHLSVGLVPQLNQQGSPVDSDERGGGKRKIKKLKMAFSRVQNNCRGSTQTPYSLVYGVHCVCKEEQILEISIGIIMHHNKN